MWEYPFPPYLGEGLLQDVALVGLKASIITVAFGGLDEGLLWEDLV